MDMGSEGLFISQLSSSPPLKVKVLKTTWKKIAGRLSGKKIPGTGLEPLRPVPCLDLQEGRGLGSMTDLPF